MKIPLLLLAALGATLRAETVQFDTLPTGAAPAQWLATLTGKGEPKWTVEKDPTAPSGPNVLKQSGTATFPVCIYTNAAIKDGFAEVKFKAISGKEDQAAGIVWRCRDADNYYITRANALENNVTIYHTVAGKRRAFKNVELPVSLGVWHTLRVDFEGDKFVVSLDGKKVLEATDTTFTEAGAVGLWTKADSVTLFDDFRFESR